MSYAIACRCGRCQPSPQGFGADPSAGGGISTGVVVAIVAVVGIVILAGALPSFSKEHARKPLSAAERRENERFERAAAKRDVDSFSRSHGDVTELNAAARARAKHSYLEAA